MDGVPVRDFPVRAGRPPVSVQRWGPGSDPAPADRPAPLPGTHAHDFLVLLWVESGEHRLRVDGRDRVLGEGDAFVIAPGAVVAEGARPSTPVGTTWAVVFPAEAVDPRAPAALVSWREHPLLAPFAGGRHGGGQGLRVPAPDHAAWRAHLDDLRDELAGRRDGYGEAVRALLTLLLVRLRRLDLDASGTPASDPLLAAVLDVVEARFREPIALDDVARALSLSPGHVATAVSRRTGRTVGDWILERRMREARRLLADTGLTVAEVAARVGYRDPGYFARRFRRRHGSTPGAWRDAAR